MNFLFIKENSIESVKTLCDMLGDLDYRITGLTAVNLYGYSIGTNCFDIAVENDDAVYEAVNRLNLSKPFHKSYDPYTNYDDRGWWIRIQGDVLGEPVIHPAGIKLQNKPLLLEKLEIYWNYDKTIAKAIGFIAFTLNDEITEKYKKYWQLL